MAYGDGEPVAVMRDVYKYVLKGVSLRLDEGVYALVGPNGSGKTTLLRLLAGSIAPERGEVRVYGGDPFRDHKVRALIAYSASKPLADGLETVSDYLGLYYRVAPESIRWMEPRSALRELGAEDLYNRKVYSLSEGQRRRVELAKLLLTRARVRLVDEPTTFLDDEARARVIELLRRLRGEGLMVVATHDHDLLERLRPDVIVVEGGRVSRVVGYEEASGLLGARGVYLVRARVRSTGVRPLEEVAKARWVKRASYTIEVDRLLDKLGLDSLKGKATFVAVISPEEARRLAEAGGMPVYTVSGVEVEASLEAEVYAEGLSEFLGFLAERFVVEELRVSRAGRAVEA